MPVVNIKANNLAPEKFRTIKRRDNIKPEKFLMWLTSVVIDKNRPVPGVFFSLPPGYYAKVTSRELNMRITKPNLPDRFVDIVRCARYEIELDDDQTSLVKVVIRQKRPFILQAATDVNVV